jgi:hypothetical protein
MLQLIMMVMVMIKEEADCGDSITDDHKYMQKGVKFTKRRGSCKLHAGIFVYNVMKETSYPASVNS